MLFVELSHGVEQMYCHLALRTRAIDEAGASQHSGWHADQQLSHRSEVGSEQERQPSDTKDNDPNRQMSEENPP